MEKIILIFPAWATPVEPCLWHKVAKDVQKTWLTFQRPSQFFVSPFAVVVHALFDADFHQ